MKVVANQLEKIMVAAVGTLAAATIVTIANWVLWVSSASSGHLEHVNSYSELVDTVAELNTSIHHAQRDIAVMSAMMEKREGDIEEIKGLIRSER